MLDGVGGTGLTVAGIRAAETERADRLFADPLAGAFVAAAGSPPRQATGRQAAALRLWVVARTVFLDELVMAACADGARQVVLLGAGFDTRAFRLPWPPGVRCYELDTQDVLDSKQQVLTAQHAVPGCARITIPGDLRDDWPAALRAAGLRPDQPTAWVAEGLLVYLSPDDVDQLLDRVTGLSAPGSRLGLTFRNRAPADQASPAVALRRSAAPDDPVGWLAGHGWAAQLSGAREVLQAHGRAVPAAPPDAQAGHRPRALLISAALDPTLARSRPARRRRRPASAAPRPRGQQDHQRLVSTVEQRWRDRFGAEHIAGLADALRGLFADTGGQQRIAAGLLPYPGGWRAHPPYLSQTEALLANPAAALPYYPTVSHRGGYPDGS